MRTEAFRTLKLAGPIIIGEVAQMALHIIDSAMVGAISYKHLAATALVISAVNIPFVFGIGITISVSQMVSMSHGRKDDKAVSHYFYNGFVLCTVTAILISAVLVAGTGVLRHLGQNAEVAELAIPFMHLIGISIIPMLLFMTLKQFADGLEITRLAMILSLASLPINVFLNWLLIFGNWGFPRLELEGAGWATLITRCLIFFALLWIVLKHRIFHRYMKLRTTEWTLRWKAWRDLLGIGIPSSLQICMEAGAFAVTGIIVGTISAVAQAAHQIALSCAAFTFMFSLGLSQAGSIRISNAYGNKNWQKISVIGKSTLITAVVYGLVCALMYALLRNQLAEIFTDDIGVKVLAGMLLLMAAVFQISDSTQAIGAGLLRGIKDVKVPTILIAIAYWVVGIPVGYFLAFELRWGAVGLWLGLIIGLTFTSVFLLWRFLSRIKKELA